MINSAMEAADKIAVINNTRFRVLPTAQGTVPLCRMDISRLDIQYLSAPEFERMARNQEICFEEEVPLVFDYNNLPKDAQESFLKRREMMRRISERYGPTYVELLGKQRKPLLDQLAKEMNCSKPALWKWIRRYLQSGCKAVSLADKRAACAPSQPRPDQCAYTVKTGRPSRGGISEGVVLTPEVVAQFGKYLKEYQQGREKTFPNAYTGLINEFYTYASPDGKQRIIRPISERPTFRQFYNYCYTHLSREDKDAIKTSRMEQQNNHRLLTASSRGDAIRPGWIVEVDAWEADVSIVSCLNPEQCIGRPIVYFMVDIYSKAIVAMSVSLENNSLQGITNLLINLGEDKQKYASRFGINPFDPTLWPSNFIPHEIRCDRGAEVRSDKFGKICNRLGITRTLEPPAMGSMKGLVEQCFHQLNASIRTNLESNGLITKRYNSNHHREAMLTMEDFTRMVIAFVITHNQKYMTEFLPSKEMMEAESFKPIPAMLWDYGCKKHGIPKMITDVTRDQYFFDLMPEKMASISRKGITYNGLKYYNSEDAVLLKDMYIAQENRIKFPVRIDPQDVERIYYMRNNTLRVATLNPGFPEQMSYAGLTWQQFEEYKKAMRQMKKDGNAHNLQIALDRRLINEAIISGAATEHLAVASDMREARKDERYLTNNENRLIDRVRDAEGCVLEQPKCENELPVAEKGELEPYPDLLTANKIFISRGRR